MGHIENLMVVNILFKGASGTERKILNVLFRFKYYVTSVEHEVTLIFQKFKQ